MADTDPLSMHYLVPVELMAKALMLCFPGPESLHWSHNKINRQLNLRQKDNIVGGDFSGLLNELRLAC